MTAALNIITWNKAYSIFPRETFIDYEMLLLVWPDDWIKSLLTRYEERGWRLKILGEEEAEATTYDLRSIADDHTWKMAFDTTDIRQAPLPDHTFETFTFVSSRMAEPRIAEHKSIYDLVSIGFQ